MSCGAGNEACETIRSELRPALSRIEDVVLALAKKNGLALEGETFYSLSRRLEKNRK